jgi:hypothetical protein
MDITVVPLFRELVPTDQATYRKRVQAVLTTRFQDEPWADWVAACLRHPCLGIPDDQSDAITAALRELDARPVAQVAHAALTYLTVLVPPATPYVQCTSGTGNSLRPTWASAAGRRIFATFCAAASPVCPSALATTSERASYEPFSSAKGSWRARRSGCPGKRSTAGAATRCLPSR